MSRAAEKPTRHPSTPIRPQRSPWGRVSLPSLGRLGRRWSSLALWLELIRNLAVRDVETRYKHSLLGLYWAIVNPLVTAAIFSFIFGVIFNAGDSTKPIPYVVFVVTGLTFWNFFANGVGSATVSITGSAALLAKLYFPRVVMPTASVLARLIDFGFSLFVLVIFVLAYHVPVHWTVIAVLPVLALQVCFTFGIAYIVAALNVLYRDMQQLVTLVLMVWMYLSPVMFSTSMVPASLQPVLLMNPVGGMLQAERDLIFTGHLTDATALWSAVAWTAFIMVAGLTLFKRLEPLFAEVM